MLASNSRGGCRASARACQPGFRQCKVLTRAWRRKCKWLVSTVAVAALATGAVAAVGVGPRSPPAVAPSIQALQGGGKAFRSDASQGAAGAASGPGPGSQRRCALLAAAGACAAALWRPGSSRAELPPPSRAEGVRSVPQVKRIDTVINSYTENAGVAGQSNKDVAQYAQLGDGLKAATIFKPKFDDGDPSASKAVQNGDRITVDLIGYLTGWNGNVFVRTQDKSGFSEKPLTFKVGAGDAIPGLDRGVVGMLKGEKRRLIIPPNLGYPRPCTEEQLGKPGAIPDPRDSASGSGAPWELRNRLLNGVLNNARDDTLVIDVKVARIAS